MSDVFFSTNPADWEALEGLYISEKEPPGFIRGQSLSTVGIAGKCVRGPTTPLFVGSAGRFVEVYGERDYGGGGSVVGEVWAALLNKPFAGLVVRRVAAAAAAAATLEVETGVDGAGTAIARISASSVGVWGNQVDTLVTDATDGDANHWNLQVKYRDSAITYENLDTTAGNDNLAEIVGDDAGRFVTLTKLADGRPANYDTITETDWESKDGAPGSGRENWMYLGTTLTLYTTVAGDDGTIAATDYTAGLDDLAVEDGVAIVLIPEIPVTPATIATKISTLAAAATDRVFLTWPMVYSETIANAKTDVATYTRSDRIIYCFNDTYTLDPNTGLQLQQAPHVWMASILSNNDVDVHPGSRASTRQTAGISKLENSSVSRADLIAFKDLGVCVLERIRSQYVFRSGITTDLNPGKTEITRRRSADFLQLSAADRLWVYVKEKLTLENQIAIVSELSAFSSYLKEQNRIINDYSVLTEGLNSDESKKRGIFRVLWQVDLFGHILSLVVETQIGVGVTIVTESA